MKRILLDENIPLKLLELAPNDCEPHHVLTLGWAGMSDGRLVESVDAAGFDVFVTADQSLAFQQNMRERRFALIVLSTNNWPVIREHSAAVFEATLAAESGTVELVTLPYPGGAKHR